MKIYPFGTAPQAAAEGYKLVSTVDGTEQSVTAGLDDQDTIFVKGAMLAGHPGQFEFARFERNAGKLGPKVEVPVTFEWITQRLIRNRARRRRLGIFDHSAWSWDIRTSRSRAWRIWRRINGVREPLLCANTDRPVPWNSYHN